MLAKNTKGLLEGEYPKDSGIRLKEVVNLSNGEEFQGSYEITVPAKVRGRGKGRIRKRFKDLKDAKRFADLQFKGLGENGNILLKQSPDRQTALSNLVPSLESVDIDELKVLLKGLAGSSVSLSALVKGLADLKEKKIGFERAVEFGKAHLVANRGEATFAQVVDELLLTKRERLASGDLRPQSVEDFEYRSKKLVECFGAKRIELVSRAEVVEWVKGLELSLRSNENYIRIAVEIFNYAIEEGHIGTSPLQGFKGAKRKALTGSGSVVGEIHFLDTKRARNLLIGALENPDLGLLGCVVLGLFCGLRTEEIRRLEWKHVRDDSESPIVTVSAEIAKKRRIRHVEIPENALLWLSKCRDRKGKVVQARDKNHFNSLFRKLQKIAGFRYKNEEGEWVSEWGNNAMRHSYASYHFAKQGDPIKTAVQMGHKANDQTFFDHYRALATKEQGEAFFSIAPPKTESKIVRGEFVG